MRFGKGLVSVLTALMLAAAVVIAVKVDEQNTILPLGCEVSTPGGSERIEAWRNDEGGYILFLPGYADLSQTKLTLDTYSEVSLDGRTLADGMSAEGFSLDIPYALSYRIDGRRWQTTLTFVRSAGLPTLYIDTESGSTAFIHADKENEEAATMRLYGAEGQLENRQEVESISCRGNATFVDEKKPYSLNLAAEEDLLGMGSAQRWILIANSYDHSHLKNKMVMDFAQELGLAYSPGCEWVDLYLNGEYVGLYLLSERNEVHPQRVALNESRSFLVSKEWEERLIEKEAPYVALDSGVALRIYSSAFNNAELTDICQSVENAILAADGVDPVTGKHWTQLLDLDSWVKKYLIEEVFANADGGFGSQFFYYDATDGTGKLYAGPVWDYDISMVYVAANGTAHRDAVWIGEDTPWYDRLYQKAEFREQLLRIYKEEFVPLLDQLREQKLDAYTQFLSQAAYCNRLRWHTMSLTAAVENIRSFLELRMEFLQDWWYDGEEFCWVTLYIGEGVHSTKTALRPGQRATDPVWDYDANKALGWYTVDTDEPFDLSQKIYEDVSVYVKYPALQSAGTSWWMLPIPVLLAMLVILFAADKLLYWKDKRNHAK